MPHMYILECADGSYYTGSTRDLERRLQQHQNGLGANHTAKRLPVKLVYCEYYDRVEDAFHREKQIQGWSRRKKQALIKGNPEKLAEYSRNYTQYPPASVSASASTSSADGEYDTPAARACRRQRGSVTAVRNTHLRLHHGGSMPGSGRLLPQNQDDTQRNRTHE